MAHQLPTIEVLRDGETVVINERDFDPSVHTRANEAPSVSEDTESETEGEYTPPFTREHDAAGYYDIFDTDGRKADRVRGKDAADKRISELEEEYGAD